MRDEGHRVGPAIGADIHGAQTIRTADDDAAPARHETRQFGVRKLQGAGLAGADADGGRRARALDVQGAGADEVAVQREVRIGHEGQVVRAHRLGARDGHDAGAGAEGHRVQPGGRRNIHDAGAIRTAEDEIPPAVGDIGELRCGQGKRARSRGAEVNGSRRRCALEGERAAAGQGRADGRVGVGHDGQVVGTHVLRAIDVDAAAGGGEGDGVEPAMRRHVHGAAHGIRPEDDVAPPIGDACQLGIAQRQCACGTGADAHTGGGSDGVDAEHAGAGEGRAHVDIRIGTQGQVVGPHREGAVDVDDARTRLQGQGIGPAGCTDIHDAGHGGATKGNIAPAIDNARQVGGIEVQGARLSGADPHGHGCGGGQDRQTAGADEVVGQGEVRVGADDQIVRARILRAVDVHCP